MVIKEKRITRLIATKINIFSQFIRHIYILHCLSAVLIIGPLHAQSHGTKSHMLVSKLRSRTFKTKAGPGGLVRVALFWKSDNATFL